MPGTRPGLTERSPRPARHPVAANRATLRVVPPDYAHAVARAALSPPARAAVDRDRLRPGGLFGAAAPASAGAPLHLAHPDRDPRGRAYPAAARLLARGARL